MRAAAALAAAMESALATTEPAAPAASSDSSHGAGNAQDEETAAPSSENAMPADGHVLDLALFELPDVTLEFGFALPPLTPPCCYDLTWDEPLLLWEH